jgi:hypothetical protein
VFQLAVEFAGANRERGSYPLEAPPGANQGTRWQRKSLRQVCVHQERGEALDFVVLHARPLEAREAACSLRAGRRRGWSPGRSTRKAPPGALRPEGPGVAGTAAALNLLSAAFAVIQHSAMRPNASAALLKHTLSQDSSGRRFASWTRSSTVEEFSSKEQMAATLLLRMLINDFDKW